MKGVVDQMWSQRDNRPAKLLAAKPPGEKMRCLAGQIGKAQAAAAQADAARER